MYQVMDYQSGKIKLSGRSRGTVLDNRDPLKRGRIIVKHPLLGDTVWIPYLRTPSSFNIPSIGDIVYVECDVGEHTHPVAWGNLVTGNDSSVELPEAFKRNIPTNRGWFTPGGHLVEFDDGVANLSRDLDDTQFTTESRGIRFTTTAGNKFHITEDADNSVQQILLSDVGGNKLEFNYNSGEEKITLNSKLDTVFNTGNDKTESIGNEYSATVGSNWTVESSGKTLIKASSEHEVDAPLVRIGSNAQAFHAVLAENLISYNDFHTHPAPQAPAGTLITLPPVKKMSDIAGTVLDVTALKVFLIGNA